MKLFVDTGLVEEVKTAHEWGILDGVTTNPTLIAKAGRSFKETVIAMAEIVHEGTVSAEVVATDYERIIDEAHTIASWHPNVVVKVPMTLDGIRAIRTLASQGIRTNCTLVFSVSQALLAAKAGATYVSIFVGRVDDISSAGMDAVADSVRMVENYGMASEILAASIRHPLHIVEALNAGAHIATVPFKVLEQMFVHPLTEVGLKRFLDDFNWAGLRIEP